MNYATHLDTSNFILKNDYLKITEKYSNSINFNLISF